MKLDIQLFASGESQWFEDLPLQMKLTWESTAGNAEQNYSVVTAKIWGARDSGTTKGKSWNGYLNIGGNVHNFSEIYTGQSTTVGGAWVLMAYYTDTIPHNADGSKTITIYGGLGGPSGTSLANKWCEGSTTAVLDTIPRGSTFDTAAWGTAGRDTPRNMSQTISFPATQSITPAYHKLEARFMNNGTETTICTRTGVSINSGYINFTFSSGELSTIYNLMTTETTHYIRMYLYTYTDSAYTNQIGDVSVLWWTGLIPSSVVPTASFTSYIEGGDVPNSWGVWVKSKSKVNLTLAGTGAYGSTITGYSISGDGNTYTTNPVLTNYLSQAGSITFTGIVTDSRSRQGSDTLTISVDDYYNPTISTAQVQRCDVDGNIDANGEYVYVSYGGSISSCSNKNTPSAVYQVGYRVHNTGSYTYIQVGSNANSYSASGMLYTDGIYAANRGSGTKLQLSSDYTYDIQFYVEDYFTNSTNVQVLDTGADLMNFNASGKSMAIGRVSERGANEEYLDVALNTNFEGSLEINSTSIFDLIYPVGSIYMSVNNTSPATLFGGTWVALQDRFLIGASSTYSADSTGGEATHTLTIDEIPSHNHQIKEDFFNYQASNSGFFGQVYKSGSAIETNRTNDTIVQNTGGGQAHNNMPPYLAVYMWKRTN